MVHVILLVLGVGLVLVTLRAALQFARLSAGRAYARDEGQRRFLALRGFGPTDQI
jgi:hypothetical protein